MLFIKRLKNLWELSKYQPKYNDGILNTNDLILEQDVFPKKKQVLATIIQDKINPFEL